VITLKVRIPAPTSKLLVNLLGVFGLAGIAVAVGGLTHNVWWALLVGSIELVAMHVAAVYNGGDVDEYEDDEESSGTVAARPRAV
jgi:hypothetical protein